MSKEWDFLALFFFHSLIFTLKLIFAFPAIFSTDAKAIYTQILLRTQRHRWWQVRWTDTDPGGEREGGDMTDSEWWDKSGIWHAQLTGHMHWENIDAS
jgi:hypothetical protein